MVSGFSDDLDPVVECHTENEFWQLVVAIETTPAFLRGLEQLEDHRERRPVGQASLRSDRALQQRPFGQVRPMPRAGAGRPFRQTPLGKILERKTKPEQAAPVG